MSRKGRPLKERKLKGMSSSIDLLWLWEEALKREVDEWRP